MEVLEDIVLGDLPNYLKGLKTPLNSHVRVVIETVEAEASTIKGKPPKKKKVKFSELSICGMWADREDMNDPAAYVRKLRAPRYKNAY